MAGKPKETMKLTQRGLSMLRFKEKLNINLTERQRQSNSNTKEKGIKKGKTRLTKKRKKRKGVEGKEQIKEEEVSWDFFKTRNTN